MSKKIDANDPFGLKADREKVIKAAIKEVGAKTDEQKDMVRKAVHYADQNPISVPDDVIEDCVMKFAAEKLAEFEAAVARVGGKALREEEKKAMFNVIKTTAYTGAKWMAQSMKELGAEVAR